MRKQAAARTIRTRVAAKDRAFIKGQRYMLLSHCADLTLAGCRSLRKLLRANLLKEEFGQLGVYRRECWARQFFTRWRSNSSGNGSGPSRRLPP